MIAFGSAPSPERGLGARGMRAATAGADVTIPMQTAAPARIGGRGGWTGCGSYWYWMYIGRGRRASSSRGVSSASPFLVSLP